MNKISNKINNLNIKENIKLLLQLYNDNNLTELNKCINYAIKSINLDINLNKLIGKQLNISNSTDFKNSV